MLWERSSTCAERQGGEKGRGANTYRFRPEAIDFVQNPEKISENQSNIEYLAKKFLDKNGDIKDTSGYHKAIYAADNVDKIASHFYEQGKADAVKEVISSSKNPTFDKARTQSSGEVFIGGLKVKSVSGMDSSKLKIKKTKFN